MRDILNLSARLLAITFVAAAALGGIYSFTKPAIDQQDSTKATRTRTEVLQSAKEFEKKEVENSASIISLYKGSADAKIVGYVFEVNTKGYAGEFMVAVGIDISGKISGVKVGTNSETPGLGAEAVKPEFQGQFTGKLAGTDLRVVKGAAGDQDISAITGATITSRGVTDAVNIATTYYRKNLAQGGAQS